MRLQLHPPTAVALVVSLVLVIGLSVYGDDLGIPPNILEPLRTLATGGAMTGLAFARALLRDGDGDGVPDVLQGGDK